MITSIQPKIDLSEVSDGIFRVFIGSYGVPVDIKDFQNQVMEISRGDNIQDFNPEHMIRNMAICLAIMGTDVSNLNNIKTILESGTFKI